MSKRITVMIDNDLDSKLRKLQAQAIMKDTQSHSFSSVLNAVLRKVLK